MSDDKVFHDLDEDDTPLHPPVWVPPSSLSNDRGRRKNTPPTPAGSSRNHPRKNREELLRDYFSQQVNLLRIDLFLYGEAFIDSAGDRVDPRTVVRRRNPVTGGDKP